MLEGADERGSYCEDSPLTICGRAGLGAGWSRGIDDILVALCDVWAVAGGVERGHDGRSVEGGGEGERGGRERRGKEGWAELVEEVEEEEEEEEKRKRRSRRSTRSAAAASSTMVVDSSESVRVCIPQAYGPLGLGARAVCCYVIWLGRLRRSHLVSVQSQWASRGTLLAIACRRQRQPRALDSHFRLLSCVLAGPFTSTLPRQPST